MVQCFGDDGPNNSEDDGRNGNSISAPFRLQKFNLAWQKAQFRLDDVDQQRFYVEMAKLDAHALKAKHEQASGKNPEDNEAALEKINKKLYKLLKEFKLYDVINALEDLKSSDDDARRVDNVYGKKTTNFADQKLNKLWEEAKKAGFNEHELEDLHEEFEHHQKKQEEYEKMTKELEHSPDRNSVVKHFEEESNDLDDGKRKSKLKSHFKYVGDDFNQLVGKVENEKVRSSGGEFKHPKVKTIWENALKSPKRFTDVELASLKEELRHFQTKLEKMEFVENELGRSKYQLGKNNKDLKKVPEYKELETKYKEYERKIEKLESYLKSKIVHSEL